METNDIHIEPRCTCGGYLMRKMNLEEKYKYQCARCGKKYEFPPPTVTNNSGFIEFLRKILGIGGGM
jgi:hypothetical protein